MKILSFGLDNSILNKSSVLAQRVVEYGNLVEKYTVIVPANKGAELNLSDKVKIYGVAGENKFIKLFNLWCHAKILLKNAAYDIITVQDQYYLALIGLCLAKKFKVGLEIQVHGFEKYYGLRKLIAKYILPRADVVRGVSQKLKKQLINEFGVKEEKITVAPIYTRIKNYELRITNNQLKNNNFIFLTVGRLVEVKNIGMQIRALANIIKQHPNIELWVIGSGPEEEKLKVSSFKFQVSENVKFFGWQENLDNYYSQTNAFLLTSNSEGWGMAVIEVAAHGLPIIMTDVGCAGEVIINGKSGMVIPVGDRKKLEENMIKLIEDEELRKRLGENAKSAVNQLLGKEQILELYKKSWEKAIINNK